MSLEHPDYYRKPEKFDRVKFINKIVNFHVEYFANGGDTSEILLKALNKESDVEIEKEYKELFE